MGVGVMKDWKLKLMDLTLVGEEKKFKTRTKRNGVLFTWKSTNKYFSFLRKWKTLGTTESGWHRKIQKKRNKEKSQVLQCFICLISLCFLFFWGWWVSTFELVSFRIHHSSNVTSQFPDSHLLSYSVENKLTSIPSRCLSHLLLLLS